MVEPKALLALAEQLAEGTQEAEWRQAARLAYYAVYHLVARYFERDTTTIDGRHEVVRDALFREPSMNAPEFIRSAKQRYDRLLATRIRADYDLRASFPAASALTVVEDARRIFAAYENQ